MGLNKPLAVVILAAGKGSRMKSDIPKVMHEIAGLPMINWVIRSAECLSPDRIITVIGQGMDDLASAVQPHETVVQNVQNGTGGALQAAAPLLNGFKGDILVLLGDTPLISTETMRSLIDARHIDAVTGISVLGAQMDNPSGYGRLLMNDDGILAAIREEKDASEEERAVKIVNTGAFCLDSQRVDRWLMNLDNKNAQSEYYITDLPEIAARDDIKTRVCIVDDVREVCGCNTKMQLSNMEGLAQQKMREFFIDQGVKMHDPSTVYLHHDTEIGAGTIIEPNVFFGAEVRVGENVHIKAFSHLDGAIIGNNTTIGPFARLRPGTELGVDVRVGNFVEIKKSQIGDRSKISHLGYVGDCIMDSDVNFSCGAITVNYDGFAKHQTKIGKGVMVGSNVNLVAPLTLDDGAFIAAGSTITKDVPADALSMTRPETQTRKGWAALYRKQKSKS